jgi:hypothetical protein
VSVLLPFHYIAANWHDMETIQNSYTSCGLVVFYSWYAVHLEWKFRSAFFIGCTDVIDCMYVCDLQIWVFVHTVIYSFLLVLSKMSFIYCSCYIQFDFEKRVHLYVKFNFYKVYCKNWYKTYTLVNHDVLHYGNMRSLIFTWIYNKMGGRGLKYRKLNTLRKFFRWVECFLKQFFFSYHFMYM